jgi:lysophospholipase L1-like esterase
MNEFTAPEASTAPEGGVVSQEKFDGVQLVETEDMGQDYIDNIIFLGDSTTYGLKAYSVLSGGKDTTQVWTPSSGTLTLSQQSFATIVYPETGNEITIQAAVEVKQPTMMVITLGVNGVSFMDEEYFKSEYTSLVKGIQEKSPNTKIILNSIYPVASNYEYLDSINNEKISAANEWVKAVAKETGVRYLDTQSVLHGDDGFMIYEYSNGDGLHLCADGFKVVLNYIRTHGYQ